MKVCQRDNCDKPLNRGLFYCSRSCAARDRKVAKPSSVTSNGSGRIPAALEKKIVRAAGEDADIVLREVNTLLADEENSFASIPLPLAQITYSDIILSFDGLKDLRPGTKLRYDIIEQMLRSGPPLFVMETKRSQIARVFSPGRFSVHSTDSELAEIAEASLKPILPKMAGDFTFSALAYGTSFQEEVWHWLTKRQLGLSKSKSSVSMFLVPKVPASVKPETVDHIRRDKDEKFNGFAQSKRNGIDTNNVDRAAALVIPHNERFGNLWGESFLKPLYVIWLWYEVIMRAMHRYMERMSTPVAVGRAPSRSTVEVEGKDDPVKGMDLMLAIAGNVAKSNSAVLPSDRDENGNLLWELFYLTAAERAAPFIAVLEYLGQEMIRAGLSADRSLTQTSGGVGSYGIGQVHAQASALTSEMILIQFLYYLNKFFMPGFSLYNRGRNGPPIWLTVQALDMQERDMLMKLISTAANSDAGNEFLNMIDWRTLAQTSNVPALEEEEIKRIKEERLAESLKRQEKQQKVMQKFGVDGKLQPKKGEPDKKPEEIKQEGVFPLVLSTDDAKRLNIQP